VLVNLLTNALRYGRAPVLAEAQPAGNNVVLRIHDSGPGVPKRHEASIWRPFERGAHRGDGIVGSLGIGLSIARTLVEAHGGVIGYRRSDRLGGACFEFTVPAGPPSGEQPRDEPRVAKEPIGVSVAALPASLA
jgi:two-component system sensor histidine kinase KdpD